MKLAAFILVLAGIFSACAPRLPKVPSLRDKSHIYIQPATWQEQGRMELYGRMDWLIIAGVVAVAASIVVSMAINKKIGAACLVGSAGLIGVAMFVKGASPLIPWIIGACVLLYLGPIAWRLFVEKRGTREQVELVEVMKPLLSDNDKLKVFGDETRGIEGIASEIQSDSTKALVKKEREKLIEDCPPVQA